jgi:hypothetical protein
MEVNTTARVTDLNSDYLDGYNANALVRIGSCGTGNAPNDDYPCTFTIHAPRPGFVILVGSADVYASDGFD